jgi:hypothetical protein
MFKMIEKQLERIGILHVAVIGAQYAPSLVAFLENAGVRLQPAAPDFADRLHDGTVKTSSPTSKRSQRRSALSQLCA